MRFIVRAIRITRFERATAGSVRDCSTQACAQAFSRRFHARFFGTFLSDFAFDGDSGTIGTYFRRHTSRLALAEDDRFALFAWVFQAVGKFAECLGFDLADSFSG